MDNEAKQIAKEALELSKENNKLLKKLVRHQNIAATMRLLYWLVILGFVAGAYYFIEPYLDDALDLYEGARGQIELFQELGR